MGLGVAAATGVVAAIAFLRAPAVPDPAAVRLINLLTMVAMGWTLAGIVLAEFLWRRLLRSPSPQVKAAFIVRLAVREGTALLGLAVCLLAALNGVLRAYPAYWVDAVPAGLFLSFLWARWPSLENLRTQVADAQS